jgi:hypothetical protein
VSAEVESQKGTDKILNHAEKGASESRDRLKVFGRQGDAKTGVLDPDLDGDRASL